MSDDDKSLREAFAALRASDARKAPPFEAMRERAKASPLPVRRRWPLVVVPLAGALAAAAALVLLVSSPGPETARTAPRTEAPVVAALVVVPPPSSLDFLLDMPSASLLDVPDFDSDPLRGRRP